MRFGSNLVQFEGHVTLTGHIDRRLATDWTVGFVQVQWMETNWYSYRGLQNSDGSLLIQRGRLPARPPEPCLDCKHTPAPGDFFVTRVGTEAVKSYDGPNFPKRIDVVYRDDPKDECNLVERNSITNRPNYLSAAQLELFFCTILSVRDPQHEFHHLAAVYWNVRWEATFQPQVPNGSHDPDQSIPAFHVIPIGSGTRASVGPVAMIGRGSGFPDPRVERAFHRTERSCNTMMEEALQNPQNRRESPVWTTFDVRR
ncbi:MAG: hypothetical protein FWD68_04650 [Alphaproteobacteria bacterium]|nr:hypothetical protein [Alphaproteobacteria bacterium]